MTLKRKRRMISKPDDFSLNVIKYLEYCEERNLTENTIKARKFYLGYLERFLLEQYKPLHVNEITEDDVRAFFKYMRDVKGNAQMTINSAMTSIKPFFSYLNERKIITENPTEFIRKGKVDQKPIIPFTTSDIEILLKQPDKSRNAGYRDYCIMLVLLSTGMRINECLYLLISDIDFKNNRVIIRQSKNRTARVVGLANKVKPELQRFIRLCNPSYWLFENQDGGRVAANTIQENIRQYGKKADINPRIRVSPHTFRHTYAINYLKNGGSTASLREQLGHRTIETVEKYLYWSTDDKLVEFQKYNVLDNNINL